MSRSKVLPVLLVLGLISMLVSITVVLAQGGEGTATIQDSNNLNFSDKLSDQAVVAITDLPALGEDQSYEGWFVSDDGERKESTGVFEVEGGAVNQMFWLTDEAGQPTGESLIGGFDRFVVTIEPVPDDDPGPSAVVALVHRIPEGGILHIRHLLYSWQGNPEYTGGFNTGIPKGITVGLREQADVALLHADLSARSATLDLIKLHACHVVNIVEGSAGENFDASCGNPGDGFGVSNYAVDSAKHAAFSIAVAPDDDVIVANGEATVETSNSAGELAGRGRDRALDAMASDDVAVARLHANNAKEQLADALAASQSAYGSAQAMATYTLAEPSADPEPPKTGDPSVPTMATAAVLMGGLFLLTGGYIYRRSRKQKA